MCVDITRQEVPQTRVYSVLLSFKSVTWRWGGWGSELVRYPLKSSSAATATINNPPFSEETGWAVDRAAAEVAEWCMVIR